MQQQLVFWLQHAEPPFGAVQWVQSFFGAQVALPDEFFLQQMMKPGLPQVDLAAHFCTRPRQLFGRVGLLFFRRLAEHLT